MKRPIAKRLLALALMFIAGEVAIAQEGPPIPSPWMLATIPDLSTPQQLELRKIFQQRRDAEEALFTRQQADFAALRAKNRAEHERIDDSTDASVRKLLGEEGYRKFAQWQVAQRPDGPHERGGPGAGPGGPAGPAGRPPGAAPAGPRPPHGPADRGPMTGEVAPPQDVAAPPLGVNAPSDQ